MIRVTPSLENHSKFHVCKEVMDGLKNTSCRHLGRHRSFGDQLRTSSFPTLVEDLERTKVGLVRLGEAHIHPSCSRGYQGETTPT